MKHLLEKAPQLLRGPCHILAAILIGYITYCYVTYSRGCALQETFCLTKESTVYMFKWLIAVTQFIGIVLLLWDLDSKIQTLTKRKLIKYFNDKLSGWFALWKKPNIKSELSYDIGGIEFGIEANTTHITENRTIEQRLLAIEKTLSNHAEAIAKAADTQDFRELRVNEEIRQLNKNVAEGKDKIMNTVINLHVGGYTKQLWSIYLIVYSALISIVA